MQLKLLVGLVLIAITYVGYGVDALIVTKDGKSIVGHKVVKRGNILSYTTNMGKRESIELKKLYQVLPKVVRGHKYSPKTVSKYIKYARRTMCRNPKLRKQIQLILDEWLAVRRQFAQMTPAAMAKMKKQINQMFAAYARSPKTDADFYQLKGDLEMLRYKDLQGAFEDIIDSRIQALGRVFVTRSLNKLRERCNKATITVGEYRRIAEFERQLSSYNPPPEQLKLIKVAMDKARTTCVRSELASATAIFNGNKTLSGYLSANERISGLLRYVAEPRHNFILDQCRRKMRGQLKTHDFGVRGLVGFPVTSADKTILSKTRPWVSKYNEPISDPAAIIFPAKFIPQIVLRQNESIAIRAIFCRQPPVGALGVNIQPYDVNIWKPACSVSDAHLQISFSTDDLRKAMTKSQDPNQKPDRIQVSLIVGDPSQDANVIVLSNGSTFRLKQ